MAQFAALMDQDLQQCVGVVREGACEKQIVQHEEIAVDDGSRPDVALRDGARGVRWKKSSVSRLDLIALQDRLIGNRLGDVGLPRCRVCRQAARSRRRQ